MSESLPTCPEEPEAILAATHLSREQKIRCLKQLEYDARELLVAEEENMGSGDTDLLDRVLAALHALGAGVDTEHTPPTKHGGV